MREKLIALADKHFTDLNPLDIGREECAPGHSYGPAIRNYFLIHYVEKGRGVLYTENGSYNIEPGMIFIIKPGETTVYTADNTAPWSYIWAGFNGKLAEQFRKLETPVMKYDASTFRDLLKCADLTNTREEFAASKLYELYSTVFENEKHGLKYELQVMNYINTNYMLDINIEEIANIMGLNRRYLSRIFKRYTGVSLQEYLINTRLKHAGEMLLKGYSVGMTAQMTGYKDQFNFSKAFKQHYGVSPRAYKNAAEI